MQNQSVKARDRSGRPYSLLQSVKARDRSGRPYSPTPVTLLVPRRASEPSAMVSKSVRSPAVTIVATGQMREGRGRGYFNAMLQSGSVDADRNPGHSSNDTA